MKPLLRKTTKPFTIFVLIILVISIPVYFVIIDSIWKSEIDEHHKNIATKTAYELNKQHLSDEKLQNVIALWKSIQPSTNIFKAPQKDLLNEIIYTTETQPDKPNFERYRCLSTIVYLNKKPYRFILETNIEENRETITAIALATFAFFIIILIGFLTLTRKLTSVIWKPFRDTLEKLKKFNLHHHSDIQFLKTDIIEFEDLNQSLYKLLQKNVTIYKTQKEFTENASHELQTPLAILKNKLDILLQSKDLTENQYIIIEDMNRALSRSARINKNLILLAKIDNHQFDASKTISFDSILLQSLENQEEHFQLKNFTLNKQIPNEVNVIGNESLIEILINNFLLNAIRHTKSHGLISLTLSNNSFEMRNSGEQELNADLLFKRFSKFKSTNFGSGLGLAIIYEIAKFHGWTIHYKFENNNHLFSVNFQKDKV